MATANPTLIHALRNTAKKLKEGASYQWGHMGACNCGNLAQELTPFSKAEIHAFAMERHGDWSQQILEFCPASGYPMDLLIDNLIKTGLTLDDLSNLEKLSDQLILKRLPEARKYLNHNRKEDVILYMETWANLLEDQLLLSIDISDARKTAVNHTAYSI
ncbi:MAG: hypothetical protein JJU28_23850 [Cyclobacteriaceae bacterium]|nr:hypothetical protein [Cyclobacteriaceae bacterium]